jgi:hypothetical protein
VAANALALRYYTQLPFTTSTAELILRDLFAEEDGPPLSSTMAPPDDTDHSDESASIDSDVAFAFVDFSGVDFGDDHFHFESNHPSTTENRNQNERKLIPITIKKMNIIDMPDGQHLEIRHAHDPLLFEAQNRRLKNLLQWFELGIRPCLSSCKLNMLAHEHKDEDLFNNQVDDLPKLLLRSLEAQDDLNTNLPPHKIGEYENSLKVAPSTIEGAGNGLFATAHIPKGAVVCNYSGFRHHYQSQKRFKGSARAYVLKLQNGWPKHNRMNDGFVDALPTEDVLARFINDPKLEERCNVKFEHIQEPGIWHCPVVSLRDIEEGEELYISYGPVYWAEQD